MDINILQRELDELSEAPDLFALHNFRARKEALDFVRMLAALHIEESSLLAQAQRFGEKLRSFNRVITDDFYQRLQDEHPAPAEFRRWLVPYSGHRPGYWGRPHHGYEDVDFLLDGVLLPEPQPIPSVKPEYGMVRYEPTPASVILELTERVPFTERDIFYDLGAGLGKVTALVHLLTGVSAVGVEYQPDFCVYAEKQAQSLGLAGVRYLSADARDADYKDATIFFFFNPFGGLIFDTVLEKLRLQARKREIILCSYGSSSQPLAELPWLEEVSPFAEEAMSLAIFQGRA